MAPLWSRGTAVPLRVREQGNCPGTGTLLGCMQGQAHLSEPFLGAAPSCELLGLFPALAGQDLALYGWGMVLILMVQCPGQCWWCWSWSQCSVLPINSGDAATCTAAECTSLLLALAPEDWSKKLQASTAGADSTASSGQR